MLGQHPMLERDLAEWREWAQFVFLGGGKVEQSDLVLRKRVCEQVDRYRLQWQDERPRDPGQWWFQGSHVTGDIVFLEGVLLDVRDDNQVYLAGRDIRYRLKDFTGQWAGPVLKPERTSV